MRFGIVFNCTNPRPWRRPWDQVYSEVLEEAVAAEEMGYDHVWLSEHHFLEDGYCPSLLTVAGAIAARTNRVEIGTWVLLLPLHNPLRVAEDAAVVDNISRGRFILGVGLGYRMEEFRSFGVAREERPARMEEGIEILRLAWGEDRFSYHGRYTSVENLIVTPKPSRPGGPPIWMAVRGRKTARRAARLGCSIALAAGGGVNELTAWEEELVKLDKPREQFRVLVPRGAYVGDDPEAVLTELDPYLNWGWEGPTDLFKYYREAADHPRDLRWFRRNVAGDFRKVGPLIGNAEECAEAMRLQQRRLRASDVHITFANGLPHARKLHYMERFANEVMPLVR